MKTHKELMQEAKGVRQQIRQYLAMLLDFSFSEFITIQMTPVLYGISLASVLIFLLYLTGEAFINSPIRGLLYLFIITPVGFIISATFIRGVMEFYLVVFRIAENVNEFADIKEHIEKLSGISDTVDVVTKRIPFWKLLTKRPGVKKEDEAEEKNTKSKDASAPNKINGE